MGRIDILRCLSAFFAGNIVWLIKKIAVFPKLLGIYNVEGVELLWSYMNFTNLWDVVGLK